MKRLHWLLVILGSVAAVSGFMEGTASSDPAVFAYNAVLNNGSRVPRRKDLNIVGATFSDSASQNRTTITFSPAASPTFTGTVTAGTGGIVGPSGAALKLKGGAQTETSSASALDVSAPADWRTSGKIQRWYNNDFGTLAGYALIENSLGVDIFRLVSASAYIAIGNSNNDRIHLSNGNYFLILSNATVWTFTPTAVHPQASNTADIGIEGQAPRRLRLKGTALVNTDFALSGGWGNTASVGSITGDDSHVTFTVTSAGTGQAAAATITLTFKNGTWSTAPRCVVDYDDASTASELTSLHFGVSSTSATTAVIKVQPNAPVATHTYTLTLMCIGSSAT